MRPAPGAPVNLQQGEKFRAAASEPNPYRTLPYDHGQFNTISSGFKHGHQIDEAMFLGFVSM